MGLKKANYKVVTGDILPQAYAIFSDIKKVSGSIFEATFSIYRDRESFNKTTPYENKKIKFVWDRKKDLVSQAYEESKKQIKLAQFDVNTGDMIESFADNVFTDWDDDII